jgi:hypothetical protein
MAVYDILLHQRAVIEFLIKKNNSAVNIFDGLHHVRGEFFMGSSSELRQTKRFTNGNRDVADLPRTGRQITAITECNEHTVDALNTVR